MSNKSTRGGSASSKVPASARAAPTPTSVSAAVATERPQSRENLSAVLAQNYLPASALTVEKLPK